MRFDKRTIPVIFAVAVIIASVLPVAESDADSSDDTKMYGATFGTSMEKIDEMLKLLFGESLKELVEGLFVDTGYDVKFDPALNSKFAISRKVTDDGGIREYEDRLSGYFVLEVNLEATGNFPAAGTYNAKEGESSKEFLERVFTQEGTGESRTIHINITVGITIDAGLITMIDMASGEVEGGYIALFPMIYSEIQSDIIMDLVEDGEEITSMTIGYGEQNEVNDIYSDIQIVMDIDDFKVLGTGEWTCEPKITESVVRSIVSSDLAGTLWPLIKNAIGIDERIGGALPELIKSIMDSTERKLDLFDTIKSITNKKIPDLTFIGEVAVSNTVDEKGNDIVSVKVKRNEAPVELFFPLGECTFEPAKFIELIPSDVLSDSKKLLLEAAIAALGWYSIDIVDITNDEKKQAEIDEIQDMVETINEINEDFEFELPILYLAIALIVILAACAAIVMMWRGRI